MDRNRKVVRFTRVPKSREREIRQDARRLRLQLGIDNLYVPDLQFILEKLKSVYPQFQLKPVPDADLPHSDARAYCKAWVLKIRKSILLLLSNYGDGRARWTVAHELGHLILQHPRSRLDRKRPNTPISEKDRIFEAEANIFASEFLAPAHLACQCNTYEEIRVRFQISPQAAIIRKRELEEDAAVD